MIDFQVMTREAMRQRGVEAARNGMSRDSHEMNWHSPCLAEWLEGFDSVAGNDIQVEG